MDEPRLEDDAAFAALFIEKPDSEKTPTGLTQAEFDDWLWALETPGEYTQGTGQLRTAFPINGDTETYGDCCLGVLCDRFVKRGVGTWERGYTKMSYIPPGVEPGFVSGYSGYAPETWMLRNDHCLSDDIEQLQTPGQRALSILNDGDFNNSNEGISFLEIAKYIRANFKPKSS